jgi:hypothetical protein
MFRSVKTCIISYAVRFLYNCFSLLLISNCLIFTNESVFQITSLAIRNYFIVTYVVLAVKFTVFFYLLTIIKEYGMETVFCFL